MPYISEAERERARWLTHNEAIDRIRQHENCDRRAATGELRKALADNALGPLRWEGQSEHAGGAGSPPIDRQFWQKVSIGRCGVEDPYGRRRVLLILKFSVDRHWPEREDRRAGDNDGKAASMAEAKAKGGRRSFRAEIYRTLGDLSQTRRLDDITQGRLAEMVAEANNKQVGDIGWGEVTMKEHISDWQNGVPLDKPNQ